MSGGGAGAAGRVLVAGIGNVFLGDDGFGVEVVGRIDVPALPAGVDVVDYGIRGVHLAYDLLDGRHDTLIMVDALPVDGPPGGLAVLDAADPDEGMGGDAVLGAPAVDGHGMHPLAVLRLLRRLGGDVERVLVVGCRPAVVEERMGLSEPVRAVLDEAVRLVTALARDEAARSEAGRRGTGRADTGRADTERTCA
ncbi:hydrogenase maturation protease [Actinomadura rugatobispora]|uniref:Hydrogenase maturation protease n=1 Tax=Actinomadura rugatobispora TaxID=1994 RepID=A0ABW0ZSG5_9ACTN|nr:hydrogenase maturation protease [Actinomadura rugatobispora]